MRVQTQHLLHENQTLIHQVDTTINNQSEANSQRWLNLIYNHGQNIWHEIDKPNKTGQKKKSLISTFACFLTAIAKV